LGLEAAIACDEMIEQKTEIDAHRRWSSEISKPIDAESTRRPMIGAAATKKALKRAIDITGACVGLILFGPLMIIISVLLTFEKGPTIFAHERIGQNAKKFRCFKFRTMAPDADAKLKVLLEIDSVARSEWERDRKLRQDPRITKLGSILRETSLDELPQFINVLTGEMSLVGPRPITADEVTKYGDKFSFYTACKPGITGAWQVSGRNDVTYEQRVNLDADYSSSHSLMLDFTILLKTFGVVLSKKGAR